MCIIFFVLPGVILVFSVHEPIFLTEKGISATSSFFFVFNHQCICADHVVFFFENRGFPAQADLVRPDPAGAVEQTVHDFFVGICFFCSLCRRPSILRPCPLYFKESGFEKSWSGIAYSVAAIIEVPMFWIAAKVGDRIGRFYILSVSALFYAIKCLVIY